MKYLALVIVFLCFSNASALAQEDDATKIGILPIKYEDSSEDAKQACSDIDNMLYDNFSNAKQVELIERQFFSDLQNEKWLTSAIDFVDGETVAKTRSKGAKYLLLGQASCRVEEKQTKSSDGSINTTYECFLTVGLRLVSVETGSIKYSYTLKNEKLVGGLISFGHNTRGAAVRAAANKLNKDIKEFIDTYFPKEAVVKGVIELDKKGEKAEKVEVRIGNAHGVQKKDKFVVKEKIIEEGEAIYRQLGEIEITEVNGNKLSTAKVTKGGEVIKQKLDQKAVLVAITK